MYINYFVKIKRIKIPEKEYKRIKKNKKYYIIISKL